jgi:hypothetical protein
LGDSAGFLYVKKNPEYSEMFSQFRKNPPPQ